MEGTKKAEQDRNLKIHSTSLARMFFTLQMQVTMVNKPGWMLGDSEAVCNSHMRINSAATRLKAF